MKAKNSNSYSLITAYISLLPSFYSVLYLYINQSNLWLPLGLSFLITFIIIFSDISKSIHIFNKKKRISYFLFPVKILVPLIYFISTVTGIIIFIIQIPINDRSIFLIPSIIISILFAGVSIGIYHPYLRSNK